MIAAENSDPRRQPWLVVDRTYEGVPVSGAPLVRVCPPSGAGIALLASLWAPASAGRMGRRGTALRDCTSHWESALAGSPC